MSSGGISPGGNIPGGNCPLGVVFRGVIFRGGDCPGGNCPRTVYFIKDIDWITTTNLFDNRLMHCFTTDFA